MTELKLAILSQLIQAELTKIEVERILDYTEKSKYRNLNKATSNFVEYIDNKKLKTKEKTTIFGEISDVIEDVINKALEEKK